MAQVTKINGVTITNHIKIGQDGQPGYMATAILGSPGSSTVIIDDPDADLDIETWQDYTVDETDCSFQRLFTGIIYSRKVIRGPYRSGVSRQWELEVVDMGQLLAQRVITGADGNRPEEDDTDRVAWLLGSAYLTGLVYDNGFVSSTNPQNMFPSDHRGETPMELLVSLAGEHFKNAYVYYDESAGQPSLFYGPSEDTLGVSTIGFSNVPGDADHSSIFEPSIDAETEMAGEDRYGGIFVRSPAGDIYRQKAATITAMQRTRDVVFSSDRIGRAATAEQVASDLLTQHADDLQTVRFTAELPSSKVNLARPGMTMDVTFEHVPGYESGVTVFVQSTIIQQKMVGQYIVQFVVAPNPKAPLVSTGGDPGDLPNPVTGCPLHIPGGTYESLHSVAAPMAGDIDIPAISGDLMFRFVGPDIHGFDGWPAGGTGGGNVIRIYADGINTWACGDPRSGMATGSFDFTCQVTDAGANAALKAASHVTFDYYNGDNRESWHMELTYGEVWGLTDPAYPEQGPCTPGAIAPPRTGQWVYGEVVGDGDGTTTTFTTEFPYAAGSLHVFVDGVPIINGLTETDPTTGDFTLDFAPKGAIGDTRAERVTANYQGI